MSTDGSLHDFGMYATGYVMTTDKTAKRKTTGPEPKRIKLKKPWEKAVGDALKKERPAEGWPDQPKQKSKKKKPA